MNNNQNIDNIIHKYIESETINSAIMINGEWGSGKTYYAINMLCPLIEEKTDKKCVYTSLNGISNTNEISKEIFIKNILSENTQVPKWLKTLKSYSIEAAKIILDKISITDESVDYNNLLDMNNCVLIFDDLERCLIDIKEIIGYITKFVEHYGIPTIIIANEEEIIRKILQKNEEFKYFLATLDSFDFCTNKNSGNSQNLNSDSKISKNEIKDRVNYLFGENIDYYKIKEKFISNTIRYTPNIDELYKDIIKNYEFNENEINILLDSKDLVVGNFISENHNNLRTLQFILSSFLTICEELRTFEFQDGEQLVTLNSILNYLTILSVMYRKVGKLPAFPENSEYSEISFSKDPLDFDAYVLGFAFVNDLVISSFFDKERLILCIKNYLCELKKNALYKNHPVNEISRWWLMKEDELDALINKIFEDVENNIYAIDIYPEIIAQFITFEKIGFNLNIDQLVLCMKDNIEASEGTDMWLFDRNLHQMDNDDLVKYNNYINQISNNIEIRKNDVFKYEINNYILKNEKWSKEFLEYVNSKKNDFLNRHKFFALIDLAVFFKSIESGDSNDIINISSAIKSVYNFSNIKDYYENDLESIRTIYNKIRKLLYDSEGDLDKIKKYNIQILSNQLDQYIKKLS